MIAVKSEPFDSSDAEWPSTSLMVSYNGMSLEVQVTYDGISEEDEAGQQATESFAKFIYDKLIAEGY